MLPLTLALAVALGALGLYLLTLRQRIVALGREASGQGELLRKEREQSDAVMRALLDRHLQERTAWAAAAAQEREQLLRHAADERAALVGAIDAARTGAVPYVAPPWSDGRPDLAHGTAEADEIAQSREAYVAELEHQAAIRGVDIRDVAPTIG